MKFCQNCGKQLADEAKFCDTCGAAAAIDESVELSNESAENASAETTVETADIDATSENAVAAEEAQASEGKKKFVFSKKLCILGGGVLAALIIAAIVIWNVVSLNQYKEKLEQAYESMVYGAELAEDYATLESKVWRNCIYEEDSSETDIYTKDLNGNFYEDFNDALTIFYFGERDNYDTISENVAIVSGYMSELKDCPKKLEDEYKALKELYVAYSDMTDLAVGNSSYSWNTFNEALGNARANYKNALSSAKLLIE